MIIYPQLLQPPPTPPPFPDKPIQRVDAKKSADILSHIAGGFLKPQEKSKFIIDRATAAGVDKATQTEHTAIIKLLDIIIDNYNDIKDSTGLHPKYPNEIAKLKELRDNITSKDAVKLIHLKMLQDNFIYDLIEIIDTIEDKDLEWLRDIQWPSAIRNSENMKAILDLKRDINTYQAAVAADIYIPRYERAMKLGVLLYAEKEAIKLLNFQEPQHLATVIESWAERGQVDRAKQIVAAHAGGVIQRVRMFNGALLDGLIKAKNIDAARTLFIDDTFEANRDKAFMFFIKTFLDSNQVEQARSFALANSNKISQKISFEIGLDLMKYYLENRQPEQAKALARFVRDHFPDISPRNIRLGYFIPLEHYYKDSRDENNLFGPDGIFQDIRALRARETGAG